MAGRSNTMISPIKASARRRVLGRPPAAQKWASGLPPGAPADVFERRSRAALHHIILSLAAALPQNRRNA
eukprot:1324424-Karenia_brevis.AAC.1